MAQNETKNQKINNGNGATKKRSNVFVIILILHW